MQYHYDLPAKLQMIGKIFSIKDVLALAVEEDYIKKYYWINKIPYSIFHHFGNAVHMGISRNGQYKNDDLYEQARTIERYVRANNATNVLELGGGRGINSIYLAKRNTNTHFASLDFSISQTNIARGLGKGLLNFQPVLGSYQDLSIFEANSFDIVFAVETLCHSIDIGRTLAQATRVLSRDGVFIVFDGYCGKWSHLTADERTATILVGKGMAVAQFNEHHAFCEVANRAGLRVVDQENLSKFVVPTMQRFEHLAGKFFRRPARARILSALLPKTFMFNAVSGFLMPTLMETGATQYWVTVFQNK